MGHIPFPIIFPSKLKIWGGNPDAQQLGISSAPRPGANAWKRKTTREHLEDLKGLKHSPALRGMDLGTISHRTYQILKPQSDAWPASGRPSLCDHGDFWGGMRSRRAQPIGTDGRMESQGQTEP